MNTLNDHLPLELTAQQTYLAFSLRCDALGFYGCGAYFKDQSHEERGHLETMLAYLNDYDLDYTIPACPPVACEAASAILMFAQALDLERAVTASLSALAGAAVTAGDYRLFSFVLKTFLPEQVETERRLLDILQRWDLCEDQPTLFDEWVKGLI
jgi:ferritin